MSVQELLGAAGATSGTDTKIALGGPMRGEAIFDLSAGVPKYCSAVTLVREGLFPSVQPNPCINCGECVLACPARIQPGMLSRFAEFKMFDSARSQHVGACLECGMCTFVCPANRPVLQYILLAKQFLAAQDADVATCRLQD
jgi:electron transport complex protein RnfC